MNIILNDNIIKLQRERKEMCVEAGVGLRMKEKEISVFHIKKTMGIQIETNKNQEH